MSQTEDTPGELGGCWVVSWWLLTLAMEVVFIAAAVHEQVAWKQAVILGLAAIWPIQMFLLWRMIPYMSLEHSNPHVP